MDIKRRAIRLKEDKRRQLEARVPRLRQALPQKPTAIARPLSTTRNVILGSDQEGQPFRLDERSRLEHMHIIGTTGGGKTNLIEHMARQDILNGRGVCVIDPHGGHPESLYRRMVTWLGTSGLTASRSIHLIDPNDEAYVTGFNPLAVPAGHDPAVVAEAALEAFQRLWGDEDPDSKPTIQRVLSGTFTALAELGLTLAEARLLFDPEDIDGLREFVLSEVRDEYAREELGWLQAMGSDRAGIRDLRVEVTGPRNRLGKLVRLEALRHVVGQTDRAIDLRHALDRGDIILANLSGGARAYEKGADILGRLLVRFLLFHAKRREQPHIPYFVYLDECQRYLSGDVPTLLAEVRKQGIGLVLAHQWQSQLASVDEEILSAVRSGTNIKVAFRIKDQKEAADLAEMVMPLNLEMPVDVLTKETVTGYELGRMRNASTGGNTVHTRSDATTKTTGSGLTQTAGESVANSTTRTVSEQESWAETHGTSRSVADGEQHSRGVTLSHTESEGDADSAGVTIGSGRSVGRGGGTTEQSASSRGSSFAESYDVPVDPWHSGESSYSRAGAWGIADSRNVTAGYDSSRSNSHGSSENWSEADSSSEAHSTQRSHSSGIADGIAVSDTVGTSRTITEGENESTTHGITRGVSLAEGITTTQSKSTARSQQESTAITAGTSTADGQTWSTGWSEALVPILGMRPGGVHSKDNVIYMAAQTLRSLRTGTAFINFVDHSGMNSALLQVPLRKMTTLASEAFAELTASIASRGSSAQPAGAAAEVLRRRRLKLTKAAHQARLPAPEPIKSQEFRVPNVKGRSNRGANHD